MYFGKFFSKLFILIGFILVYNWVGNASVWKWICEINFEKNLRKSNTDTFHVMLSREM